MSGIFTSIKNAIANAVTDLKAFYAASSGASMVGYMPAGTGAVATDVQTVLREDIRLTSFAGVDPTGATDSTTGVKAALLAGAGGTIRVKRGTYTLTEGISITGENTHLLCEPGTVFSYSGLGALENCLTLTASSYQPIHVSNLTLNCNNSGWNGIFTTQGAPKLHNVVINAAKEDGIQFSLDSARSDWIENLEIDGLLINGAGRHPFHVYMTGVWNGTPFFNETLIEQFEVRGIGLNSAGASAIKFTFDGTTVAPVTGFTVLQSNFDAQVSGAVAPVSHTISAESVNGGVGALESLFVKGGGWESTSGIAPGGLYNFFADPLIAIKTSVIMGITNYNWAYNVGPSFASEKSNYYCDANGAHYPSALAKADGYAFKGVSGYLGGFTNNPTAYRNRDFLVASGNKTFDIPIAAMSDYSAQAPLTVTLFHKGFFDSLGFYGYGTYLVSPSRTNADFVHSVVLLSGSSNPTYSFIPANVTFSIPAPGTLRVTIPGGADVGGGGTNTTVDVAANRMFVDLPGLATALTL